MLIAFMLEGIGIMCLYQFGQEPLMFVILSGLVFFAWGEIYSLFPSTNADTFGTKFAAANAGLLYTAKGTASLLVPLSSRADRGDGQLARGVRDRRGDEHRRRAARLVRAATDAASRDREERAGGARRPRRRSPHELDFPPSASRPPTARPPAGSSRGGSVARP